MRLKKVVYASALWFFWLFQPFANCTFSLLSRLLSKWTWERQSYCCSVPFWMTFKPVYTSGHKLQPLLFLKIRIRMILNLYIQSAKKGGMLSVSFIAIRYWIDNPNSILEQGCLRFTQIYFPAAKDECLSHWELISSLCFHRLMNQISWNLKKKNCEMKNKRPMKTND